MSDDGSITRWLNALREHDDDAARELWRRYFQRLQTLARNWLGKRREVVFDSEDIAVSAFDMFCRVIQDGRYPGLGGRNELWPLLAKITSQKARDYRRKEQAQKRTGAHENEMLPTVEANVLPPDIEVMMAEECKRLLDGLDDSLLVEIATFKLDGWTNEEIAIEAGYTRRTIQRMLNVIRLQWQAELDR